LRVGFRDNTTDRRVLGDDLVDDWHASPLVEGRGQMGTRDKASNRAQDLKGKAKEAVGATTGNEDLRTKGKADQTKASLKDAGEKVKDAGAKVKEAVKGR
jgi:uncharacterized protein YjbJ (UPF0337 family)